MGLVAFVTVAVNVAVVPAVTTLGPARLTTGAPALMIFTARVSVMVSPSAVRVAVTLKDANWFTTLLSHEAVRVVLVVVVAVPAMAHPGVRLTHV